MIRSIFISVLFLSLITTKAQENNSTYVVDKNDVSSIENIIYAVYDVISGPAGTERNWDRFRSLFYEGAKLTAVFRDSTGDPYLFNLSVEDFVERAAPLYLKNGFFEKEIFGKTEQFNHIAHRFSTYETWRNLDDPEPFGRGINSFQFYNDGKRWWIQSIFWEYETEQDPIPLEYLPQK
ncbi:MAG: hypothetical protein A2V66_04575 [Ignavibacteria bacterium RBG_13_36_8]|nr:MAG: hypothetical protein A2V66_04575 [Ignavibacteria bacterium RBG_13_36_8]